MNAKQAIDRSISHTEVVAIDHDPHALEELKIASRDWTDGNDRTELWGTRDGDGDWRVHVRHASKPDHVHCECGEATGERCAWTGPKSDTEIVEWMPWHLRESHRAAGNWRTYPANGALRLRVHHDCAEMLRGDEAAS